MKIKYYLLLRMCRLLLMIWLLSGCAYTTKGTLLGPITPPQPTFQPTIEHTVGDFSLTQEGGKIITSNYAGKLINDQVFAGWKEHKYIRDEDYVESGAFTRKADYNVILSGSEYIESNIGLQILSGLTLFLIPATTTTNYDLQYTLVDVKTGKKYSGSVQETNKSYAELFLIFAFPFSVVNQKEMFERIGDHVYNQLYQQGAFQHSNGLKSSQPGRSGARCFCARHFDA